MPRHLIVFTRWELFKMFLGLEVQAPANSHVPDGFRAEKLPWQK